MVDWLLIIIYRFIDNNKNKETLKQNILQNLLTLIRLVFFGVVFYGLFQSEIKRGASGLCS